MSEFYGLANNRIKELLELLAAEREQAEGIIHKRCREINRLAARVEAAELRADTAEKTLEGFVRLCVGESYNLLTQGERPTQRRGPSAQRIYDAAKAIQAAGGAPEQATGGWDETGGEVPSL